MCVESGGPEPGVGCAGRGIITSINLLESLGAYTDDLDYVFYDVLGDVVCGVLRCPFVKERLKRSILSHQENSWPFTRQIIFQKGSRNTRQTAKSGSAVLSATSRKVDNERPLLEAFAKELGSQLIYFVPRDNLVQRAEIHKKTVVDFDPTSNQANEYRNLAQAIDGNKMFVIPKPMKQERLEEP